MRALTLTIQGSTEDMTLEATVITINNPSQIDLFGLKKWNKETLPLQRQVNSLNPRAIPFRKAHLRRAQALLIPSLQMQYKQQELKSKTT